MVSLVNERFKRVMTNGKPELNGIREIALLINIRCVFRKCSAENVRMSILARATKGTWI